MKFMINCSKMKLPIILLRSVISIKTKHLRKHSRATSTDGHKSNLQNPVMKLKLTSFFIILCFYLDKNQNHSCILWLHHGYIFYDPLFLPWHWICCQLVSDLSSPLKKPDSYSLTLSNIRYIMFVLFDLQGKRNEKLL